MTRTTKDFSEDPEVELDRLRRGSNWERTLAGLPVTFDDPRPGDVVELLRPPGHPGRLVVELTSRLDHDPGAWLATCVASSDPDIPVGRQELSFMESEVRRGRPVALADVPGIDPDGRTMVYVAGPMSGLPNYNFDAFHQASRVLRARGFAVQNPADDGVTPGFTHSDYMRRALRRMMLCTEVFLLPGWQDSRGAVIEHDLAVELGMPVHHPEDWMEDLQ